MSRIVTKAALGAVAALMLGGAAQAGSYYGGGYGYSGGGGYHGGGYSRGYYGRPVASYPLWRGHDDCRLIVKRRFNRWGEMVMTRIRRCD